MLKNIKENMINGNNLKNNKLPMTYIKLKI
jgi:hypothetical protein